MVSTERTGTLRDTSFKDRSDRSLQTVVNRSDRYTLAHFTRRPVGPVFANYSKPFGPVHFSTL